MIRFAENLNKMIDAGLGGPLDPPRTEVAVGHCIRYLEASGPVASFETNVIAPLKKLLVNMPPVQSGSGDPSPENVRPITGRDSVNIWNAPTHDTTLPPTVTIQLGQTVYGGALDVLTGELRVDRVALMLTDAYNYFYAVASTGLPCISFSYVQIPKYIIKPNTVPMCDRYKPSNNAAVDFSIRTILQATYIYDSRFTDLQTAKDIVNGTQLVYEPAEPLSIQLTPEQLSTLVGDNNVWSDAGDVDVTYQYYEETEGY